MSEEDLAKRLIHQGVLLMAQAKEIERLRLSLEVADAMSDTRLRERLRINQARQAVGHYNMEHSGSFFHRCPICERDTTREWHAMSCPLCVHEQEDAASGKSHLTKLVRVYEGK
jgi:rubrerythrin